MFSASGASIFERIAPVDTSSWSSWREESPKKIQKSDYCHNRKELQCEKWNTYQKMARRVQARVGVVDVFAGLAALHVVEPVTDDGDLIEHLCSRSKKTYSNNFNIFRINFKKIKTFCVECRHMNAAVKYSDVYSKTSIKIPIENSRRGGKTCSLSGSKYCRKNLSSQFIRH